MGISGSGERDELARAYVERLEEALASATHERDLAGERARLTAEGVEQLERRLERLRQDRERERGEVDRELARQVAEAEDRREREVAQARERLEAREEELGRAREAADEARRDLKELRERLLESERELAVRERDLAARVRELGQAGEESIGLERALGLAAEQLADRDRELDATRALLEKQGAELTSVLETAREAARERDDARARLEARERHLANAKAGIESRDRRLEGAENASKAREAELASRDAELQRLRAAVRERERSLALAEGRLEKAQQRAERFQGSLLELRSGRAYRLMRILWRLRRPFKRAPRAAVPAGPTSAADDAEPVPPRAVDDPPSASSPPAHLATFARYGAESRQPGKRLRVAAVLDEMSSACFAPECDLVSLTLEDWAEQLDEQRPDLLLVESAWNGNGGEWQYRIAKYPRKDLAGLPALRALLDGCRERGIPTAFWNKEDPVHFERFEEAASLFDHVFTTDARCVERYRALPGERTVAPLPFAAQPRIHNPLAAVPQRSSSPCFAGAWYRDRHPDRRRALEALLDAARPHGLVVYDRSFGVADEAFGFPDRFAPHVLGGLPYERILDVYRSHRVFLNANSVIDSPTMCSRRVFELAACDTAILSTPGAALSALLGEGMVEEAEDERAGAAALERLLGDEPERRRRTRAARRAVFAAHTYAERLATIVDAIGLDPSSLRREPFATPRRGANGASASPDGVGDRHPWQLQMEPGVTLAETALADLAAAATFADADVIGARPASNGDPAIEHRHVSGLDPRALLLSRELIEARGNPTGSAEQIHAQLRRWADQGVRLYAADADLLATQEDEQPLAIGG